MADAQTPVLTDEQIDALVSDSDGVWHEDVFHIAGPALASLLQDTAELLAAQAPAQPAPTMADALAAGDGTLHGAVDHWQEQALAGRAVMLQALDALRLLDEAFCANDYGTREGRNKGRTALIATRAAIAALSATMEKKNDNAS